jgi:hypothetical protein
LEKDGIIAVKGDSGNSEKILEPAEGLEPPTL